MSLSFKTFISKYYLIENAKYFDESNLLIQKIISNINNFYISDNNDEITFNVGKVVGDNHYKNLLITILFNSKESKVVLGKNKDGDNYTILIYYPGIFTRDKLARFLSSPVIVDMVSKQIITYLTKHLWINTPEPNKLEQLHILNTPDGVENIYNRILQHVKKLKELFKSSDNTLKRNAATKSPNLLDYQTLESSEQYLKDDIFGNSFSKFFKKIKPVEFDDLTLANARVIRMRLEDLYNDALFT